MRMELKRSIERNGPVTVALMALSEYTVAGQAAGLTTGKGDNHG